MFRTEGRRRGSGLALLIATLLVCDPAWAEETGPGQESERILQATRARARRAACATAARAVPFRRFVAAVYKARGGGPLFHDGLVPTPEATQLMSFIDSLKARGLDRGPYGLGFPSEPLRGKPVGRKPARPLQLGPAANMEAAARMDARLVSAVVRHVLELRYFRRTRLVDSPLKDTIRSRRRRKQVVALVADLFPNVAMGLEGLQARHPQITRLQQALARYSARLNQGEKLPRLSWKRWRRATRRGPPPAELVIRLQTLLAEAGFFSDAPSGVLDEQTLDAIKDLRDAYGLRVGKGVGVDAALLKVLNVDLGKRVQRVRLALQRWRESRPLRKGAQDYIRVNVPGYTLALHEGGSPPRRYRVIVGKPGPLRTPLLDTRATQVFLNPVWHAPKAILKRRRLPRLVLRPGPKNPLGPVKLHLWNGNGILLHGTNQPTLFARSRRALSSGCVRVENAVDLVRRVAVRGAGLSVPVFDAALATGRSKRFPLSTPLPVHFEYHTVVVDDRGRARFLPDLYGHDAGFFSGRKRYSHSEPKIARTARGR